MAFRLTAETAPQYRDRHEAGRLLAGTLKRYRGKPNLVVPGLPRGGIPVAYDVATLVDAPLDVFRRAQARHAGPSRGRVRRNRVRRCAGVDRRCDPLVGISAVVAAVVAHELVEQERHEREYRRGPMTESSAGRTSERLNHYYRARLPGQFDAVIHIDETRAVEPLELWSHDEAAAAETNPSPLQT